MGPLPNLIYLAGVARGSVVLAEYVDGETDLAEDCAQQLEKATTNHSRYSLTMNGRMFSCLMEDGFIFSAIVDEALSKADAFRFLEEVREALRKLLKRRGLPGDGEGLGAHSLDAEFVPVLRRLAAPFVGIPQEELDPAAGMQREAGGEEEPLVRASPLEQESSSQAQGHEIGGRGGRSGCPFVPMRGKGSKSEKRKVKDQVSEVKEIMMGNAGQLRDKGERLEILVTGGGSSAAGEYQMNGHHGAGRSKGVQTPAQRTWWRNVKLVLLLDVVVCLVLFFIWLGICGGFKCLKGR